MLKLGECCVYRDSLFGFRLVKTARTPLATLLQSGSPASVDVYALLKTDTCTDPVTSKKALTYEVFCATHQTEVAAIAWLQLAIEKCGLTQVGCYLMPICDVKAVYMRYCDEKFHCCTVDTTIGVLDVYSCRNKSDTKEKFEEIQNKLCMYNLASVDLPVVK